MTHIVDLESVWSYLKCQNIGLVDTEPSEKYGWLSLFCSFLQPSFSSLSTELTEEKLMLIHLAKCSFIHEDLVHIQMLYTLFYKLTDLNSPAVLGSHWEIIGFQGLDPATDFRGVGILGLLQPLAACLSVQTLLFISNVVKLSHSPTQGFPFMVLSLNITNIVLKSLKEGHLDRMINQKNSALNATNLCYTAVLYFIYENWRKEKLTLADCGPVLKRAETICKNELPQYVVRLEKFLEETTSANQLPAVKIEDVQCNFTDNLTITESAT